MFSLYKALTFFSRILICRAVTIPVPPETFRISATGSIEGVSGDNAAREGHAHGRLMRLSRDNLVQGGIAQVESPTVSTVVQPQQTGAAHGVPIQAIQASPTLSSGGSFGVSAVGVDVADAATLAGVRYDVRAKGERLAAAPTSSVTVTPSPSPSPDASKSVKYDEYHGFVDVARVPATSSEVVKLEAETEECMRDTPVAVCWERFGSYGIRRLLAWDYDEVESADMIRPDWMANDAVQGKRLFDLTFPGTHHSGAFTVTAKEEQTIGKLPYGVLTQNLNITEQLMMGVRSLHFNLAFGTKSDQLYCSNKFLLAPLKNVLAELIQFLYYHPKEVVIINAFKDPLAEARYKKALLDDDNDAERVPGQRVHEAIFGVAQEMLGVYEMLAKLPASEDWNNPTIAALITANVRIIYFWEGQQVLCITGEKCGKTPGYAKGAAGTPLGFGEPMALGSRVDASGEKRKTVEPACMLRSEKTLPNSVDPPSIVQQVKQFSGLLQEKYATEHRPSCFPSTAAIPTVHKPTLFYSADAVFTPQASEATAQMQLLRTAKAVFSRGEGFTIQAEAERLNYLLLAWYMKKGYQSLFSQPNIVSLQYPAPILIHRIVEAQQNREDCGWAVYCVQTGGCWAASMSPHSGDKCLNEADVLLFLRGQAGTDWRFKVAIAFFVGILLWMLCICGRCRGFLWLFGGQYSKPELTAAEALCPCIGIFAASSSGKAKDLPEAATEPPTSVDVSKVQDAAKPTESTPAASTPVASKPAEAAAPVQQQAPAVSPAPAADPFKASPAAAEADVSVEAKKNESEF